MLAPIVEPTYPDIPWMSPDRVRAIVARAVELGRVDEHDAEQLSNAEICELESIAAQIADKFSSTSDGLQ